MKDWKDSFRLLKYGYLLKTNIGVGIFCFVLGIMFFRMGEGSSIIGSVYIALAGVYFSQFPASMEPIGLIASSPKRRMIGIHLPNIMACAGFLFTYLVIRILLNTITIPGSTLFLVYLILFALQIYISMVNRALLITSVLFACFNLACVTFFTALQWILRLDITFSNRVGTLLLIAGAVLGSILRKLVYPLPVSKVAINKIFGKRR